jgi:hypothetical protein
MPLSKSRRVESVDTAARCVPANHRSSLSNLLGEVVGVAHLADEIEL